jgi:hypothetical protein
MRWLIDDSFLPSYLRLTVEGKPTVDDYVAAWQAVIEHPSWKPGTRVLVDAKKREQLGSDAPRIVEAMARFFSDHSADFGSVCVASITRPEQGYLYSRQFEYSIKLRGAYITLNNFPDEASAVEWLEQLTDMNDDGGLAP